MTARAPSFLDRHITEAAFQSQVIKLAKLLGWRVAHFRPAKDSHGRWKTPVQADGRGYPDLTLVRGDRLIFAELKTQRGRTTKAQDSWLYDLRETPAEVYVWRPADWQTIHDTLTRED